MSLAVWILVGVALWVGLAFVVAPLIGVMLGQRARHVADRRHHRRQPPY